MELVVLSSVGINMSPSAPHALHSVQLDSSDLSAERLTTYCRSSLAGTFNEIRYTGMSVLKQTQVCS